MKNIKLEKVDEIFDFLNGDLVKELMLNLGKWIRSLFLELFFGYDKNVEFVLNEIIRVDDYLGYVIMRDILFYIFCEYYFVFFWGVVDIIYEFWYIIMGFGKLVRLVRDVYFKWM